MAVTQCAYAEFGHSAQFDERNRGTYTTVWDVTCDTVMAPTAVADGCLLASPDPIPSLWDAYAYKGTTDVTSLARNYDIQQLESRYRWRITVGYVPLESGEEENNKDQDPGQRPVVYYWDKEVFTKLVEKDTFGKEIVNKANSTYDVPLEAEVVRPVLVAEFNVGSMADALYLMQTYNNKVNKTTWFNIGPREALMRDVTSSPMQTEGNVNFWRLTMRIAINEKGKKFDREILERGYKYFKKKADGTYEKDDKGDKKYFKDPVGDDPVLLDSDGTKLADGKKGVFTAWRIYDEVDFNRHLYRQPGT